MNRRDFLKKSLLAIFVVELILMIFGSISKLKKNNTKNSLFKAGNISDFAKGERYLFSSKQFFLQRYTDGSFLALSVKCTHLGCAIKQNSNKEGYTCPCHASKFGKYGEVKSSPASRPLDIFKIIIHDDELYVDTSKPIKRNKFEPSQLTYC